MKRNLLITVLFLCLTLVYPQNVNQKYFETPLQYDNVEIKPLFPGGISEFMRYVISNYKVPEEDEEGYGVQGVLEANILIDVDGSVAQVNITKDVAAAGKQIKKIVSKCPKWQPGKNKGNYVPVIYNFTVTIK